jgi:hypothetical protein
MTQRSKTLISEMLKITRSVFFQTSNYMVSDSLVYETQLFGITQIISMRYLS